MPPLGPVVLAENGLLIRVASENETLLSFGTDVHTVLDVLIGVLGESTDEEVDRTCAAHVVRRVQFGDLEVVFVDTDELDGPESDSAAFSQWFVEDVDELRSALWTLNRIAIGSTVASLTEAYFDEFTLDQARPGSNDPAGYLRIDPFRLGVFIEGMTSNTTPGGKVLQLWAGSACQRSFVG